MKYALEEEGYVYKWSSSLRFVLSFFFFLLFFNPHSRTLFHCFLGREEGRERNTDIREKHQLVASCACPDRGSVEPRWGTHQWETELNLFGYQDDAPTNWATPARARFVLSSRSHLRALLHFFSYFLLLSCPLRLQSTCPALFCFLASILGQAISLTKMVITSTCFCIDSTCKERVLMFLEFVLVKLTKHSPCGPSGRTQK